MSSDRDIQKQVQHQLRASEGVHAVEIGVAVRAGVVTLTGSVGSFGERETAEAAALVVPDVQAVVDEIQVLAPGEIPQADERIAHAVCGALESERITPFEHVTSTISHGVVTLHGTVHSWRTAADAEQAVCDVPGVQDVIDEMVVCAD